MAYLNLDPDYFGHPKTKRLIGLLGKGADVYPIRLWCYCAKYHPEQAMLQAYLPEEIEAVVNWDGEKGQLVSAMEKVGFLKKKGQDYEVNDWLEYEGHIAKFKQRSKLAAKSRWKKILKTSNATSNAKSKIKQSPLPNLTLPNQALLKDINEKEDLAMPILYLNEKIKSKFDPKNKSNRDLIKARYTEGRTLEDFKKVIDIKVSQWKNDEKMMKYLRPSTLFNRTNFENYLNEYYLAENKLKKKTEIKIPEFNPEEREKVAKLIHETVEKMKGGEK